MFHNGSYALCDVAVHHRGNMSDINTVLCERQDRSASAFHNDRVGVPCDSAIGPVATPGGKFGRRSGRWPSRLAITFQTTPARNFCFPQTSRGN